LTTRETVTVDTPAARATSLMVARRCMGCAYSLSAKGSPWPLIGCGLQGVERGTMEKLRLVQVGLGFWGLNWAQEILADAEEVELTAFVDPRPEARADLAKLLGVPQSRCFADLDEALARVPCDAILASLPTALHFPVAAAALAAGRHVLVEKPFAATLREAQELVRMARAAGRVLMVSQNYRHYPAARAAAHLVAEGGLGRLLGASIDFRRHAPSEGYRYWQIPDPLLADMAIHHFDLIRMVLAAEPVEVSCRSWNPPGSPFAHDPCAIATIALRDGALVSYRGSWLSRAPATAWAGEWVVELEDAAVFWTGRGSAPDRLSTERLAIRRPGGEIEPQPLPPWPDHDRRGVLKAFVQAIRTGVEPPWFSAGSDNLRSLALVDACRASAREGGAPVRIADVLEGASAGE
jgi:predicted dehydrogenase